MQDGDFFARLTELGKVKGRRLSNRALAQKTGMSPTTIGCWLRGERFPSDIGKLVTVVREIASVIQKDRTTAPDGILDPESWREAYRAESSRRVGPRFRELAQEAESQGLLRRAASLRRRAALSGDAMAAAELILQLRGIFPGTRNPPWPVAEHVTLADPWGSANLMDELRRAGADEQLALLIRRGPGKHAECEDLDGAVALLGELRRAGEAEQTAALASRLATRACLRDPARVLRVIAGLRGAGAYPQIAELLTRDPAAQVSLDEPDQVVALVLELRAVGADIQAIALAKRAEASLVDSDPEAASRAAEALHVNLEDHDEAFAFRFIYGTYEPAVAANLLAMLANGGEEKKLGLFLASNPAGTVPLEDAAGVAQLIGAFQALGAVDQLNVLLSRNPAAHIAPDDVPGAVQMLDALRRLGAGHLVPLTPRDLAGRVSPADPWSLALLLRMLAEDGDGDGIAALLPRCPASRIGLRDPQAVSALLGTLQAMGLAEEAATLVSRLPAAGHFALFLEQDDHRDRYRFGRAVDGTPAAPWDWNDLD